MRLRGILGAVLLVLCAGAFLVGGEARGDETINIGIMGPFTGPTAFNGEEMKKGMMLAVDEVNEKGGIFGMKINLIYGDSESKPDKGVAAVKKLITKDQVLDFFAVALGGSGEVGVGEMRDMMLEWGGAPQSSVLRFGDKLPAPNAAQLSGRAQQPPAPSLLAAPRSEP